MKLNIESEKMKHIALRMKMRSTINSGLDNFDNNSPDLSAEGCGFDKSLDLSVNGKAIDNDQITALKHAHHMFHTHLQSCYHQYLKSHIKDAGESLHLLSKYSNEMFIMMDQLREQFLVRDFSHQTSDVVNFKIEMETIYDWNQNLTTGIERIDSKHKEIYELTSQLWKATLAKKADKEIEKILEGIENYAAIHFFEEEEIMRATQYPNFAKHSKAHEQFSIFVQTVKQRLDTGEKITTEVMIFMSTWLRDHIEAEDKVFFTFLSKKNRSYQLNKVFN